MKIKKTFQGELPENRIVNTYSNSLTDAYSANYLNDKLRNVEVSSTEPTNGKDIWVQMGKNLFNGVKNSGLLGDNGLIIENDDWFASDFISVSASRKYILSFDATGTQQWKVCYYKEDETIIGFEYGDVSGGSVVELTIPNNCSKIRFGMRYDLNHSNIQIEQGEFKTDYEPYIPKKIYVKKDNIYELVYDEANTRKEVYVGPTEPKSGEKVWIDAVNELINVKDGDTFKEIFSKSILSKKLEVHHTNVLDSEFDNVQSFMGDKVKQAEVYMIYNTPVSSDFYIQMGARHLVIGYQYANFKYGWQCSFGGSSICFRVQNNGVWQKWQTVHQTYINTEQCIGTWVNGKPLYRRVLYSSQRVEAGSGYMPNTAIPNIDIVTDVDVTIGSFGYASFKNHWSNDGGNLKISTQFDKDSGLYISADYTGFIGWVLKVEYTKTTD